MEWALAGSLDSDGSSCPTTRNCRTGAGRMQSGTVPAPRLGIQSSAIEKGESPFLKFSFSHGFLCKLTPPEPFDC